MKRIVCVVLCVLLAMSMFAYAEQEENVVRVASLKGPTSMGLVKLIQDAKNEASLNKYSFTVEGAADAIVPLMVGNEPQLDVALVPCNLASVLYNNTKGQVQIAAINTLGVLYVLENGDSIQAAEDLKGKTIYSTGKGTTPEFALNYILASNGIDPEKDVQIEFKSEATEVAAAMLNDKAAIAVLPQPYVTAVLNQNADLRVALNLTEEWDKVGDGSAMITGVVIVRKAFAEDNPDIMQSFLTEYEASTQYVNENPEEAAGWIEELEIAKAAIAKKAIPACNIVCITGEEMQEKVSGYLNVLFEQNPKSVGGTLPDEGFYYIVEEEPVSEDTAE